MVLGTGNNAAAAAALHQSSPTAAAAASQAVTASLPGVRAPLPAFRCPSPPFCSCSLPGACWAFGLLAGGFLDTKQLNKGQERPKSCLRSVQLLLELQLPDHAPAAAAA